MKNTHANSSAQTLHCCGCLTNVLLKEKPLPALCISAETRSDPSLPSSSTAASPLGIQCSVSPVGPPWDSTPSIGTGCPHWGSVSSVSTVLSTLRVLAFCQHLVSTLAALIHHPFTHCDNGPKSSYLGTGHDLGLG